MFIRRLKPSPLLAVSVGALVVGLAVPAAAQQAAHLVNGKTIKNHTIAGKKLKNNTLTGRQVKESTLGKVPNAGNAQKLGGLGSSAFAKSGLPMIAGVANGVGNDLNCAGGTLAIEVDDGSGKPVDGRFSFQVAGTTTTFGVIRGDGSIRTSSVDVTSVAHTTNSGIYCISFSSTPTGADLESTVASVHALSSQ